MRKLSKKISMLMVLAMLVSLFSGVVSASAASSWSFYNKTTGEDAIVAQQKDVTYKMEKNQFADFDLYKDGEIVDTDTYTVKYESDDEDVVWVDAKNGKLRADKYEVAEVGDIAKITAVITNKESKVVARRWFNIEIVEAEAEEVEYIITPNFGDEAFIVGTEYELKAEVTDAEGEAVDAKVVFTIDDKEVAKYTPAEAGEVTIVATVTIGEEEFEAEFVCDVYQAVIESVVQKDAKTIEITLDEKISDAEALKNINLFLGTVSKNNYKKKATVKDNVVTLESYATFGNAKTWTVVYGDSKAEFEASQGEVAKVEITGPEFFYLKSNGNLNPAAAITFVCKDKNDVIVAKGDGAYIEWKVEGAGTLGGETISFAEADKVATISGIYHTGKFDEKNNYQEITIAIDPYVVTSVDNNDASMIAISDKGVSKGDAKYDSMTVPVNRTGYKLNVKFLYDDAKASKKTPAELGNDEKGNQIVTFESTDTTKLIVDPKSGELLPLKEGKVDVVVNVKGEFFGAVTVEVGTAEVPLAPTVKASATQLSNSSVLNQSVVYTAEGKTNYGANASYEVTKVEVKSHPYNTNDPAQKAIADTLKNFASVNADAKNKVTVSVVKDGTYLKAGNYVFQLTLKSEGKEFTQTVSIFVRDAKADDEIKYIGIEFVGGSNTYDTAATKTTANFDAKVQFKFVGKNKDGVAVKYVTPSAVSDSIEIKLGSESIAKNVTELALYKVDDNGIYSVSGSAVTGYSAIKNGDYVISGKIGDITVPNTAFVVKNSQAAPTINLTDAGAALKITEGSDLKTKLADCFKALEAKAGEYSFSAIKVVSVKATESALKAVKGEYVVVVEKVEVTQNFNAGAAVKYTITLNQPITLTVE